MEFPVCNAKFTIIVKNFLMNHISKFLSFCLVFILIQCTNPTNADFASSESAKAYNSKPDKETAKAYLDFLSERYKSSEDVDIKKNILKTSLSVSTEQKMTNKVVSYLLPLIKEFDDDPKFYDYIMQLADVMHGVKKYAASNTLYRSYLDHNPEGTSVERASANITEAIPNLDTFIFNLGKKIFEEPDKYGINEKSSRSYVDACEAYAMANPQSVMAPAYLFKSAEVAKSLRSYSKAMNTYDWIIAKYPDYEKTPTSLFLKGFMMENEMNNKSEG